MKRTAFLIMIGFAFLLSGCVSTNRTATLNTDLTVETWQKGVESNPRFWTRGSDRWFLTGKANAVEVGNRRAPFSSAMSTLSIRVPNFTKVKVNGDFQVQLVGVTFGPNTVSVYGPNAGIRQVSVDMQGDTLCVTQTSSGQRIVQQVIVRIGVRDLHHLIQNGRGNIEGVRIQSGCLDIVANESAKGNIYLSGNMNVRSIVKAGCGTVNIFGAITPNLKIRTSGTGAVNVSGNVGISSIVHHGGVNVNIIGANSDSLRILADGAGKISINGPVCLKEIRAMNGVCIFANMVNSNSLYVMMKQKVRVGLSGRVDNLYVDASDQSRFMGRYLCATEAFVRAHDSAHVNVTSGNKIFASATQMGTVYFFGSPKILSQFVSDKGVVIPIWGVGYRSCPIPTQVYALNAAPPKKLRSARAFPYRPGEG